MVAREQV